MAQFIVPNNIYRQVVKAVSDLQLSPNDFVSGSRVVLHVKNKLRRMKRICHVDDQIQQSLCNLTALGVLVSSDMAYALRSSLVSSNTSVRKKRSPTKTLASKFSMAKKKTIKRQVTKKKTVVPTLICKDCESTMDELVQKFRSVGARLGLGEPSPSHNAMDIAETETEPSSGAVDILNIEEVAVNIDAFENLPIDEESGITNSSEQGSCIDPSSEST